MNTEADPAEQIAEWKRLTEHVLPSLAAQHCWHLRLDHCFKRVCLDHAFGGVWYDHVRKPAERHIEHDALQRAILCAREIAEQGEGLLRERNSNSLRFRAKGRFTKPGRGATST